jgi:hypothetical protein
MRVKKIIGFTQVGKASARSVMGEAMMQSIHRSFHDVGRRIEIGLPNFKMHDIPARGL